MSDSDEEKVDESFQASNPRPKKRFRRANHSQDTSSDESEEDDQQAMDDAMRVAMGATNRSTNANDRERQAQRQRRGPLALQEDNDDGSSDGDDESEGEDLEETAVKDYRNIAELDTYDERDIDEAEYDDDQEARRAAERALQERDDEERGRAVSRRPGMLQDSDSEDDTDDEDERKRQERRRRAYEVSAQADGLEARPEEEEEEEEVQRIDLQNVHLDPSENISPAVIAEVKHRFEDFLRQYKTPQGTLLYADERINDMCRRNTQSLLISYMHLSHTEPYLGMYVADMPALFLPHFNEVAKNVVFDLFPNYREIHDEIFVRIEEMPIRDSIRELRTANLNQLVNISGIVTRRSQVLPELTKVQFRCPECKSVSTPYDFEPNMTIPDCEGEDCDGHMRIDNELSKYRNYQYIFVQESPGTVPPGRVPRYKEVILRDDLMDSARPGEEVEVVGIYMNERCKYLNSQQAFPVFKTRIIAVNLRKKEDLSASLMLTDDDRKQIHKLAKDPRIQERVINSIAPSIYGHRHIKTALALSMFGGQAKNIKNKHRIRGDINVLLMGDPGTAKSQCLKYVEKTAPRAVYTTGKGASAVGLTAAVHKDPVSREWVLEGGALVLADQGVCLIDEFDKMSDQDRVSIHEAMEQQSISISKAGIVTTLQARCAIIAAANPRTGRYDPQLSFTENVELTDPIIQRFDVLCVLQDKVDLMADERLAKFVVGSHVKSHPEGAFTPEVAEKRRRRRQELLAEGKQDMEDENDRYDPDLVDLFEGEKNINTYSQVAGNSTSQEGLQPIPQDLLRKYILYARTLRPQLEHVDQRKIESLYVELRQESANGGGIPIAVRHMESILRMSEAFARMQLREYVRNDDVDAAIQVMLESFISAQKFSVMRQLKRSFQKYITYKKDNNELLVYVLEELINQSPHTMQNKYQCTVSEFERRAREYGVHDLSHFYKSDIFVEREFKFKMEDGIRFLSKEFQ